MKITFLIITFFFGQISFGQNGLEKDSFELDLFYPKRRYLIQKHQVSFLKGKPKKLSFEGMVYFNPASHLRKPINELSHTVIPATAFDYKASDLKPYNYTPKTKKTIIDENYFIENNMALPEEIIDGQFHTYQLSRQRIEQLFQPFFFKKHEVTNAEYWEFLESVGEMIDSTVYYRDLIYSYEEDGKSISIPIYPDTSCWEKDKLKWVYYSEYYFTHLHFENHPVVGISYNQAKAFCHWKTNQLQQSLGKNNNHFKIKVDLPSHVEWNWMANAINIKKRYYSFIHLYDDNWITDLALLYNNQEEEFKNQTLKSLYHGGYGSTAGSTFSHPADLENQADHKPAYKRKKKNPEEFNYLNNLDKNNVSSMGNNVSEWLRDTYADNWKLMFDRQLKLWEQENTPESLLLRQIALYYDSKVDKDGQLVKGANWIDRRYSNVMGKNKAGIHAKTFVSPHKSHSALGFRYVVYFLE